MRTVDVLVLVVTLLMLTIYALVWALAKTAKDADNNARRMRDDQLD